MTGLHFLGRGRHWQISQLWASVWKPKGQSKVQPRLSPEHCSSPVKMHRGGDRLRDTRTFPSLPSSSSLVPQRKCLTSTAARGNGLRLQTCDFMGISMELHAICKIKPNYEQQISETHSYLVLKGRLVTTVWGVDETVSFHEICSYNMNYLKLLTTVYC